MVFVCPYCQENKKEYKTRAWLKFHVLIRHNKTAKILVWLGIILTIFYGLYSPYIFYIWDAINGENINVYISLQGTYLLNNEKFLDLREPSLKYDILNRLVQRGIIPPWHNNRLPTMWNIKDEKTKINDCYFWGAEKVLEKVDIDELPEHLKFLNKSNYLELQVPPSEIIENLKNCKECVAYSIYGVIKGKKTIDLLNLQLCFNKEYILEKVSQELIKENNNCIRIKKENLINGENVFGYVLLKDYKEPIYYYFWEDSTPKIKGKYRVYNMEFNLSGEPIANVISAIVPNCMFG